MLFETDIGFLLLLSVINRNICRHQIYRQTSERITQAYRADRSINNCGQDKIILRQDHD